MTPAEFILDARRRIERIGLTVGCIHQEYNDPGRVYVASLETVPGCMGQPKAEAQRLPDGRTHYSIDIRMVTQ